MYVCSVLLRIFRMVFHKYSGSRRAERAVITAHISRFAVVVVGDAGDGFCVGHRLAVAFADDERGDGVEVGAFG